MRMPATLQFPLLADDTPLDSRPLGLLGRAIEAVRAMVATREAADYLMSLDDHMLDDIGITRGELRGRPLHHYDVMR